MSYPVSRTNDEALSMLGARHKICSHWSQSPQQWHSCYRVFQLGYRANFAVFLILSCSSRPLNVLSFSHHVVYLFFIRQYNQTLSKMQLSNIKQMGGPQQPQRPPHVSLLKIGKPTCARAHQNVDKFLKFKGIGSLKQIHLVSCVNYQMRESQSRSCDSKEVCQLAAR